MSVRFTMKGFAVLLVFLLIVAATVFYFGWIQIRIPAEGYGVVFSRTDGWEDDVVEPGTFVWRWQRLIPTNLTLHIFELRPHRTDVHLSGSLPSGEAIEAILEGAVSFPYEVRLTVQTRIRAGMLPMLARERGLRPQQLDEFYDEIDARISRTAVEAIMALIEAHPERISLPDTYEMVADRVTGRIEERLDLLEVVTVTPERIDLPDLELYLTARELASGVLEARAEAFSDAARQLAVADASADRQFSLLERYGEILERYPSLIDYFRVSREIDADPLNLGELVPSAQ